MTFRDVVRPSVNVSEYNSVDYEAFIPAKLVDPGGIDISIQFDPNQQPPISGDVETISIEFATNSGTGGGLAVVQGFVDKWSPFTGGSPTGELAKGSVGVKFTGAIVWTDEV